jgi:hypothetical protein
MTNSQQHRMHMIAAERWQLLAERALQRAEEHRAEASRAYAREILEQAGHVVIGHG